MITAASRQMKLAGERSICLGSSQCPLCYLTLPLIVAVTVDYRA